VRAEGHMDVEAPHGLCGTTSHAWNSIPSAVAA
jgi:hypothetical protein